MSTHTKKELQAIVDLLKPLLGQPDTSALEATLMALGLPFVCSKSFIDFCRIRNEKPLVLLLSSLAVSNDMHGAWSQRVLDIYQTLAKDGVLSGGLSGLAPRHVLRQSMALLAHQIPMDLSKGLLGSAQDVCLSIELLLDYDQAGIAHALMKMQWGKSVIDTYLLELAKGILARQSNKGIQLH